MKWQQKNDKNIQTKDLRNKHILWNFYYSKKFYGIEIARILQGRDRVTDYLSLFIRWGNS